MIMSTQTAKVVHLNSPLINLQHGHSSWICFVIFISWINAIKPQSLSYHGPLGYKAAEYFAETLPNITISTLPELICMDYYDSWWYTLLGYSYITGSNYYVDETKSNELVKYYKLTLTSEMKQLYTQSLSLSTCCDIDSCDFNNITKKEKCNYEYQELAFLYSNWDDYNTTIDQYCSINSSTSLDTNLYILQEKKGQINVLAEHDDSSCTNSEKSYIDLSDYPEGEYIIAIGGYGTEHGDYWIHLECVKYFYPIQEDQFDPPLNTTNITCNHTIYDQLKGKKDPVHYYKFPITKTTYFPIIINGSYWTAEYIIRKDNNNIHGYDYEIMEWLDWAYGATFFIDDPSVYTIGEYYIVVQSPYGYDENYSLSIICGDPPTMSPSMEPTIFPSLFPSETPTSSPTTPAKIERAVMVGVVFGSMGTLMFLLISYYLYECIKYYRNKKKTKSSTAFSAISADDETAADILEMTDTNKPMPKQVSMAPADVKQDEAPNIEAEFQAGRTWSERIRQYASVEEIVKEMGGKGDMVQRVLHHALDCCNEEEDFDIFQVNLTYLTLWL